MKTSHCCCTIKNCNTIVYNNNSNPPQNNYRINNFVNSNKDSPIYNELLKDTNLPISVIWIYMNLIIFLLGLFDEGQFYKYVIYYLELSRSLFVLYKNKK